MGVKDLKITVVTYEQYSDYEFQPMSTFFVMDSMQNYHFIHTSKRQLAQEWCDETFGKGRYTVKASKLQKTKSRQENGGQTVYATATRAKPSSRAPK